MESDEKTDRDHFKTENCVPEKHNSSFDLEERYVGLLTLYSQKKYKKARSEIIRLQCFSESDSYWKLIHLKIKCQEKIIEKKLQTSKNEVSRTSIIEWLASNEREIKYWFRIILACTFDPEDSANKLELLITFILNQCLFYGKFCVQQGLLDNCLSFLALSEKLIRKIESFISSPDTLFVIQELYLFFSSCFITNENYLTAKNYLVLVLKLSFKEIELRTHSDLEWIISLSEVKSDPDHLIEILFNISTAMYQLGVCYENEGDLEKAHQAYRQSKWFASSFLVLSYPGLIEFITDLERRIRLRIALCDFIAKEKDNLNEIPVKKAPKAKEYKNELAKKRKFERIEAYINSLKLIEVDDEEIDLLSEVNKKPMSKRVNVATRTIHVLNHLMSTQFQDVIKDMNKIEVNKLDKDTKRAIEKRIIHLKNNQRVKLVKDTIKQLFHIPSQRIPLTGKRNNSKDYENAANNTIPTTCNESSINALSQSPFLNKAYLNNKPEQKPKIRLFDTKSRPLTAFSQTNPNESRNQIRDESNYQRFFSIKRPKSKARHFHNFDKSQNDRMKTTPNSMYNSLSNKTNIRKIGKKRPKTSFKIEKIKYSEYVFNNSFRHKIEFVKGQFDKELRFQKQLLSCKREEKREVDFDINRKAIKRNCEIYFTNEYKKQKKIKKEKDETNAKNIIAENINMLMMQSGRSKAPIPIFLKQYQNLALESSRKKDLLNTEKNNKLNLNKIEFDLETICKREEYLKKKSKENSKPKKN